MGELIRIGAAEGSPELGATVDTTGAWVTSFGFADNKVFHDRFTNKDGRFRGGMHPCADWFADAKEPPHGYARSELWTPVTSRMPIMNARPDRPEMGVILEWMPETDSPGHGLRHTIELSILQRRSLRAELVIKNEDGQRIEAIAPGFHPYLNIDDKATEAQIRSIYSPAEDGEAVTQVKIDHEAELRGEEKTFKEKVALGDNTTYIDSNLMTVVTWSDDLSRYVCFEPTQAGNSLKVEDGAILLKRGDERRFFINIGTSAIENRAPRLS